MRLLDRYLLRELLIPLGYCLTGFLIFWISFDLFSELDDLQAHQLTVPEIAEIYLIKTPELLVTVIPIALLLALLHAVTHHARHHELIAMRTAGLNLWRIMLPYFVVGFLSSGAVFALNEVWVPESMEAVEDLRQKHAGESGALDRRWQSKISFRNARDRRIWNIERFNLETFEMANPQVEWVLPDGTSKRLMARSAVRTNGVWVFHDLQQITYLPDTDLDPLDLRTNIAVMPEFTETPDQIKSEIKLSKIETVRTTKRVQLSLKEIQNYLRLHPDLNDRDAAVLKTRLHARLAQPWTCLVVVLISVPFGASSARRNVFFGVAGSIFVCFAFFILSQFGLAFGTGGYIPSWLAAWLPNLLFGGLGAWLIQRVR